MKWFGKNHDAPVHQTCYEIPVPVGENCIYCGYVIASDADGFAVPFIDTDLVSTLYYHRECLLDALGVAAD